MFKTISTVISCSIFCSACGFHLKGHSEFENITELAISCSTDNDNCQTLIETAKKHGIGINPNSQWQVYLLNFDSSEDESASGGENNHSREIEFSEAYELQLRNKSNTVAKTKIKNSEYIKYNAEHFVGNEQETIEIKSRLSKENAQTALRFINSHISKN